MRDGEEDFLCFTFFGAGGGGGGGMGATYNERSEQRKHRKLYLVLDII